MDKQPKIFVIVVTYKGIRWYDKCFTSLRESTIPVETIVVDNTPGDEDANYIRGHFPEIHVIKTEENLGFGRANNLGMKYALEKGCDYVFLLNQDAWVENDMMEKLVSQSTTHPEYGILSPMHMSVNGDHLNFLMHDGGHNMELLSDLYCGTLRDIYAIQYVNAAGWLLPRRTLEIIGGFCPLIFHYGEDDDYMNRCRYHKLKIGLIPSARMIHDSGTRVDIANKLFVQSNKEVIDEYLDITKDISITSLRIYYLRKLLLTLLRNKKADRQFYWFKYQFLARHQKSIEDARKLHKIKQPNWLQ